MPEDELFADATAPPSPRGSEGSTARPLSERQRRRLLDGAAEALAEHGYDELTVANIVAAAGVSRSTFYESFADKRECLLAAHRAAFGRLMAEITRACAAGSPWPRRLRAAIAATFALAAAEPARVRLLASGILTADRALAEQASECNDHLAALLREGRRHTPLGCGLPELTEAALIGGVASVLDECLREPGLPRLAALEPELAQLLLTPYVGPAEAAWLAAG